MEDYICRDDFCHLHLSIWANGVSFFRAIKDGRLESDVNKHQRVQSYLTFENNHEITCKSSVCRLICLGYIIICLGYIIICPGYIIICPGYIIICPGYIIICPGYIIICLGYIIICPGYIIICLGYIIICPGYIIICPGYIIICPGYIIICPGYIIICLGYIIICPGYIIICPGYIIICPGYIIICLGYIVRETTLKLTGTLCMSPVKRICVFEHSVMTNFNCACPVIQRGKGSGFLCEGSS